MNKVTIGIAKVVYALAKRDNPYEVDLTIEEVVELTGFSEAGAEHLIRRLRESYRPTLVQD